ncbi:MAG: HAMP domain-containing protein, partial [Eubacteriales bacterium]|nr:HAMP domain-containing protein [Eubacteriales bacterium]
MLKSLSIRSKLGILVVIPILAALMVTLIGTYYVNKISANLTQSVYEEGYQSMSLVLNADRDAYQAMDNISAMLVGNSNNNLTPALKDGLLTSFDENIGQTTDRVRQAIDLLNQNREFWEGFTDEAEGMTIFEHYDAFVDDYAKWQELADKAMVSYQVDMEYVAVFEEARGHINIIGELLNVGAQQAITDSNAQKNQMIITMILIDVVVLAVIIALSILVIRAIIGPLKKSVTMLQDMVKGRLSRRLNLKQRDEIGVLGENLDQFADNLQKYVIGTMNKISEGDLSIDIRVTDPEDEITPSLKTTIENLRALVGEAEMLTEAAVEGKLEQRGDTEKFRGGYKQVINGFNNTLDAIVDPLSIALAYIEKIANGEELEELENNFKGEYSALISNLLMVRETINNLLEETGKLTKATAEGELSYRADAGRLKGGYGQILSGINDSLDSLVNPLIVTASYIEQIGKGEIPQK